MQKKYINKYNTTTKKKEKERKQEGTYFSNLTGSRHLFIPRCGTVILEFCYLGHYYIVIKVMWRNKNILYVNSTQRKKILDLLFYEIVCKLPTLEVHHMILLCPHP